MDPALLVVGGVAVLVAILGLGLTFWLVRTTLSMVKRLFALAFVLGLSGLLIGAAVLGFATGR